MADESRVSRTCDACGGTGTEPHHVQYFVFTHPVTQKVVDQSVSRHLQCCADSGCEVCKTDLEFVGSLEGQAFVAALETKSAEHHQALFERHGVESPGFEKTPVEA